jgi:hypothetical protein
VSGVIWVTGPPRSGPFFVADFLQQCGANPVAALAPQVVAGGLPSLIEDPTVYGYCQQLLGTVTSLNIPGAAAPAAPAAPAAATVAALQAYLAGNLATAAAAGAPYLLASHWSPQLFPQMYAAFPAGTTHTVVAMGRASAATHAASIAAQLVGVTTAQAAAYLTAYNAALATAKAQLTALGITPYLVTLETLQAAPQATLAAALAAMGLTPSAQQWASFQTLLASFGS